MFKFLLPPDTDDIKKISAGETGDPNDIIVKFQGLDDFLSIPPRAKFTSAEYLQKADRKSRSCFGSLRAINVPPRIKTKLT